MTAPLCPVCDGVLERGFTRAVYCPVCRITIDSIPALARSLQKSFELREAIVHAHENTLTVADGCGGLWARRCPDCGEDTMVVVRPGKVQCGNCG